MDYGDEWEEAWQNHLASWRPTEGSETYVSAIDLNTRPENLERPLPNVYRNPNRKSHHKNKKNNKNNPFPRNVRLMMNAAWKDHEFRKEHGDDAITEEVMWEDYDYEPVEVIFKTGRADNKYKYIVEDKELWNKLDETQKERVRRKYSESAASETKGSVRGGASGERDPSLYTVVVTTKVEDNDDDEEDEGDDDRPRPRHKRVTVTNVPRRGLRFEDLSYTTDQFLPNAFRHDIRIPDEIFPEAWKNLLHGDNKAPREEAGRQAEEASAEASEATTKQQQQQKNEDKAQSGISKHYYGTRETTETKPKDNQPEDEDDEAVDENNEDLDEDDDELPSAY